MTNMISKGEKKTTKWIIKNINEFNIGNKLLKIKPICELAFSNISIKKEKLNSLIISNQLINEFNNYDIESLLLSNPKNINLALLINSFMFLQKKLLIKDEKIRKIKNENWKNFTNLEKEEFLCYQRLLHNENPKQKYRLPSNLYLNINSSQLYTLTHYIFYITNLGNIDPINIYNTENIQKLLLSFCISSLSNKKYDIASELMLSYFMLTNYSNIKNNTLIFNILKCFYKNYTSNIKIGLYDPNKFAIKYHTILANNMMWRAAKVWKINTKKKIKLIFSNSSVVSYIKNLSKLSEFAILAKQKLPHLNIPISLKKALDRFPGNLDLTNLIFYTPLSIQVSLITIAKKLINNKKIPEIILNFWKNNFNIGNYNNSYYKIEAIKTLLNVCSKQNLNSEFLFNDNNVFKNISFKKVNDIFESKIFYACTSNFNNLENEMLTKSKIFFFIQKNMFFIATELSILLENKLNIQLQLKNDKSLSIKNLIPFYFIEANKKGDQFLQ